MSRAELISNVSRIGPQGGCMLFRKEEAIDIDSHADWSICEYLLGVKLFFVFVFQVIRKSAWACLQLQLILANEILDHKIVFVWFEKSKLAFDKISRKWTTRYTSNLSEHHWRYFPVFACNSHQRPLDTSEDYIRALKAERFKVVNIEDLGPQRALCWYGFNVQSIRNQKLCRDIMWGSNFFVRVTNFYLLKPKYSATM